MIGLSSKPFGIHDGGDRDSGSDDAGEEARGTCGYLLSDSIGQAQAPIWPARSR